MIFVSTGTTNYQFSRLLTALLLFSQNDSHHEKIIIQSKNCHLPFPPQVKIVTDLPFPQMVNYLKNARVVICHGGAATIFLALKYCHYYPLIVPRYHRCREHINDHQVYFARFLHYHYQLPIVNDQKNFIDLIHRYIDHPSLNRQKYTLQCSPLLIKKLDIFTHSVIC